MSEGSLEAPERHPLAWTEASFYDDAEIDSELRRQFDVCHGCRRCFNLCDSFPKLFDLIDESDPGELDTVSSTDFKPVIDACTLCDMCFMTKCPYVPPHEFAIDFPHLMLRARAAEMKKTGVPFGEKQLTKTDRNGRLAAMTPGLANWASKCGNHLTRPVMESALGVHRDAALPKFHSDTFEKRAKKAPEVATDAPAHGRKAVLYATCFANFNNPDIGSAARHILALNGVETEVVYPRCCGMPQLEQGDIAAVADAAKETAAALLPWVEKGYDIIALVPSCALMLKFEWPLILPDDENIKRLSTATSDITEYVAGIAKNEGMAGGLKPLDGGVTVHIACHARAQNMGQKGAEILRLIPETEIKVIERCSGHGGSWGIMKDNFETGLKVGKPVARQAAKAASGHVVSECPLARDHILQGIEKLGEKTDQISTAQHPIELLAKAYGI
ncbi:MAG: glycerol-3-phosphate dehydrogenase [Rhodospirillaceae bacterium]|nr:glycerol-3-phosphate dehydrogenase [Rhodospirillaceae bacterium]MBT5515763.1 glycerol-3-phosphate dehydrogenase [Rhodospirillaceae bacterium]MBT6087744.1 glycerol-3-phosphate dehydrogenase [Rhodospirillaceae bacterium]MBT6609824.1 glycerol-3-phosphate dehydrogenase [Rhodospirillaceae bacterium]MBT6883219.1 glycerol-3-phosphate dehydrogenase [Rhodospirillaceae bacterium]